MFSFSWSLSVLVVQASSPLINTATDATATTINQQQQPHTNGNTTGSATAPEMHPDNGHIASNPTITAARPVPSSPCPQKPVPVDNRDAALLDALVSMDLAKQNSQPHGGTSNGSVEQVHASAAMRAILETDPVADTGSVAAAAAELAGTAPASPLVVSAALWSSVMSAEG